MPGEEQEPARDAFRIRDHVPEFDEIVRDIKARSRHTRSTLRCRLNVSYGEAAEDRLDLFFPDGPSAAKPVHLFIHGGYWRMFSKDDYSYVADTVTQAGAIAAVLDYTLMPAVRMATLVEQVRRARRWLLDNALSFGGSASDFSVSGHSAGAHLATFLCTEDQADAPDRLLLLGGLYDLKPLRASFLQAEIGLTEDEVSRFTPMSQAFSRASEVKLVVGADETEPFHRQAADFHAHLESQRMRSSLVQLPGVNHMSSVRNLGVPGSDASIALRDVINSPSQ